MATPSGKFPTGIAAPFVLVAVAITLTLPANVFAT